MTGRRKPRRPDDGSMPGVPARDQLPGAVPAIARRIRTLRRKDSDWAMRTSELTSTTVRRVLLATDGGAERLPEPLFWGLIETIVRNLLVDRFRRNGVRRAVLRRLRDGAAGSDAHVPSPAVDPELRDAATRVLQALTADERALVQLRMQGLEWSEVGDALGISEAAARQRWATLRRRARTDAADK